MLEKYNSGRKVHYKLSTRAIPYTRMQNLLETLSAEFFWLVAIEDVQKKEKILLGFKTLRRYSMLKPVACAAARDR